MEKQELMNTHLYVQFTISFEIEYPECYRKSWESANKVLLNKNRDDK